MLRAHVPIVPSTTTVIRGLVQCILLGQIVDADILQLSTGCGNRGVEFSAGDYVLGCSVCPVAFVDTLADFAVDVLCVDSEV